MNNEAELLDTRQAAAWLGCTPAALVKFRAEQRGPGFVRVGRLIRYRLCDLRSWIEAHTCTPENRTVQRG